MSRGRLLAAGAAAYLLALFAGAPAELARGQLEAGLPDLRLGPLHGHPLAGHAAHAHLAALPLGRASWRWAPGGLLEGRLAFTVEIAAGPSAVTLVLAGLPTGEVAIDRINGNLDLAWLGTAFPDMRLAASGRIEAEEASLLLGADGWPREATGRLRLRDAALLAPLAVRLGAADATLAVIASRLEVDLTLPPGGPLAGDGRLRLAADGTYAFEARVAPGPEADTAVREFLRRAGPAQDGGRVRIAFEGAWR